MGTRLLRARPITSPAAELDIEFLCHLMKANAVMTLMNTTDGKKPEKAQ